MLLSYILLSFPIYSFASEMADLPVGSENKSAMAIVPYTQHLTLGVFHKKDRSLTFAGKRLTIYQDWNDGGVAAVLWDAAIVLSRYMEENATLFRNKRVIELGAGTGLVGMVASLLGGDVIVTDRATAIDHTKLNIEKNLKEGLSETTLKVQELVWGQDVSTFSPPFDVILGADIVYIEETFNDLLKTLKDLSNKDTVVLMSCKIRYEKDSNFLKLVGQTFDINRILYNKQMDISVYMAKLLDQKHSNDEL